MQLVIGEIGPGAATALQAVKLLAAYLSGDTGNRVGVQVSAILCVLFVSLPHCQRKTLHFHLWSGILTSLDVHSVIVVTGIGSLQAS